MWWSMHSITVEFKSCVCCDYHRNMHVHSMYHFVVGMSPWYDCMHLRDTHYVAVVTLPTLTGAPNQAHISLWLLTN